MGVGLNFVQRINPAWFLAGAAFFLPIKPAPVNLLLVLALAFTYGRPENWRVLGQLIQQWQMILLLVLITYLLSTFLYAGNDVALYHDFLSKYGRFLLIPLLIPAFRSIKDRVLVAKAFSLSMAITLVLSYFVWLNIDLSILGIVPDGEYAIPSNPTVFKKHITHNFFMAIALYFWLIGLFRSANAIKSNESKAWFWAILYGALVIAALINLFAMVDGRTGWVVFCVIPFAFCLQKYGLKGLGFGFILPFVIMGATYLAIDNVQDRVDKGFNEVSDFFGGVDQKSSVGERLMLQISGWQAFLDSPVIGHGIGGIKNAVTPYVGRFGGEPFQNPHNQYLLLLIQGGILGLALYLAFIASIIQRSYRSQWFAVHCAPVLLMFVVGNLLNSFHYDFSESVAFILLISAVGFSNENV